VKTSVGHYQFKYSRLPFSYKIPPYFYPTTKVVGAIFCLVLGGFVCSDILALSPPVFFFCYYDFPPQSVPNFNPWDCIFLFFPPSLLRRISALLKQHSTRNESRFSLSSFAVRLLPMFTVFPPFRTPVIPSPYSFPPEVAPLLHPLVPSFLKFPRRHWRIYLLTLISFSFPSSPLRSVPINSVDMCVQLLPLPYSPPSPIKNH